MKNLIFSSGSYNGTMYIGCIKYLEEAGHMRSMTTFVGTSVGSIAAFLLAIGFTSEQMTEFVLAQFASLSKDADIDACALLEMCSTYGLDDGERLLRMFRAALAVKGAKEDLTFMELGKTYGKNLIICGANVTQRRSEFFSIDTSPDMSIVTALRISCSIPIIFTPVKYKGDLYVDGGVYSSLPFDYTSPTNPLHEKETLAINVLVPPRTEIDGLAAYVLELLNSVMDKANDIEKIRDLPYVCNLDQSIPLSVNLFEQPMDEATVQSLIDKGYKAMADFFIARQSCAESP